MGAVTTSALTMLWITATDLFDDWRAGAAEWPEFAIAAVAALMGAGWMVAWVARAINPTGTRRGDPFTSEPPVVWDREIDRTIKVKNRHKT